MSFGAGESVEEKAVDWMEVHPNYVEERKRQGQLRRRAAFEWWSDAAALEDGGGHGFRCHLLYLFNARAVTGFLRVWHFQKIRVDL